MGDAKHKVRSIRASQHCWMQHAEYDACPSMGRALVCVQSKEGRNVFFAFGTTHIGEHALSTTVMTLFAGLEGHWRPVFGAAAQLAKGLGFKANAP